MKIHEFARLGDITGVAGELKAGESVDAICVYSRLTPLMYAAGSSSAGVDMLEFLIGKGADVNAVGGDVDEFPVVFHAAKGKDIDKVRMLIDAGADVSMKTAFGYDIITSTVCAHAQSNDDHLKEIVQLFIDKGVPVDFVSSHGESGIRVASGNGRFEVVRLLLDSGADGGQLKWTELMNAVVFGTLEDVRRCVDKGGDLSVRDSWGRTAWLLSIQVGDIAKSKLLLEAGDCRNVKGHCDKTPLMYAVTNQRLDMLRWLLDEGFDIEDTDRFSTTALIDACENGYADCVKILLGYGAKLENEKPGRTLAEQGADLKNLITKTGIDVNELVEKSSDGFQDMLSKSGTSIDDIVDCFEKMSECGLDDYEVCSDGEKAMSAASNLEVVRLLIDAGGDINDISKEMRHELRGGGADEELHVGREDYGAGKNPRYGESNPEVMDISFWKDMVRSGVCAYRAKTTFGEKNMDEGPVWCFDRFGQSITLMPDGRIIEIGGEHEDFYDPDFHIYNDVVVHDGNGEVTIYGYPKDVFGPTDFHTAMLVDGYIYIIGCLGYRDERIEGLTPVYRLDCESFSIEKIETAGQQPGWISRHKARVEGSSKILITGGDIYRGEGQVCKNQKGFILDLADMRWGIGG
ncbi:MAG: ankyrin repeat domain-containing protein [Phycisphaerae bacterium]|nr:ankyrin repeat domain-containing protein [Phycisphaerae bacterium]